MMRQHLQRSMAFYGERKGLLLFRKHALQYLKFRNMPRSVRTNILQQEDAGNFLALLEAYYTEAADSS